MFCVTSGSVSAGVTPDRGCWNRVAVAWRAERGPARRTLCGIAPALRHQPTPTGATRQRDIAPPGGTSMDESRSALAEAHGFRAEANRNESNTATMWLHGGVNIASAGATPRAGATGCRIQQFVLDLSHITFCDAAGVRFLLTARKQARTTGWA
jgi:STAS domain